MIVTALTVPQFPTNDKFKCTSFAANAGNWLRCVKLMNATHIDSPSEMERIRATKVGVGTLSPGLWLDVYGTPEHPGQETTELKLFLITEAMMKDDFERVTTKDGCEEVLLVQTKCPKATDSQAELKEKLYLDQVAIKKYYKEEYEAILRNIGSGLNSYDRIMMKYPKSLSAHDKPIEAERRHMDNHKHDQYSAEKRRAIVNASNRLNTRALAAQVI